MVVCWMDWLAWPGPADVARLAPSRLALSRAGRRSAHARSDPIVRLSGESRIEHLGRADPAFLARAVAARLGPWFDRVGLDLRYAAGTDLACSAPALPVALGHCDPAWIRGDPE